MKLQLTPSAGKNLFTGYGAGYVMVNQVRHETSLVALPDRLIAPWQDASFASLSEHHFEYLLKLDPEIVVLGTGPRLRFPSPTLARCLSDRSIGVEVMDTMAACRTYNILVSEGRNVAAALLLA